MNTPKRFALVFDDEVREMLNEALRAFQKLPGKGYPECLLADILADALHDPVDGKIIHFYDEDAGRSMKVVMTG